MNYQSKVKIALVFIFVAVASMFIANRIVYKPHELMKDLNEVFAGTANDFKLKYLKNPAKWSNAIVLLNGEITSLDNNGAMLSDIVFCQFEDENSTDYLKEGKNVTVKGRFIGYDDLLEEMKLDNCIILFNNENEKIKIYSVDPDRVNLHSGEGTARFTGRIAEK